MHPPNQTSCPSDSDAVIEYPDAQDARESTGSPDSTSVTVTHTPLRLADALSGNLLDDDEAQEVMADD
jgi:hypothetical protein